MGKCAISVVACFGSLAMPKRATKRDAARRRDRADVVHDDGEPSNRVSGPKYLKLRAI